MTARIEIANAVEAVAARTASCRFTVWGFGEGPALVGLLRAGRALRRGDLIDLVADLVAPSLRRRPEPTDHLVPVEVLLELARLRPGLDVRDAVAHFVHAVTRAPRPYAGRPRVHRPDLPDLGTTVWVDCLHTDGPGLRLAGHPVEAVTQVEEVSAALQDETGLYSHGYDVASGQPNAVHWGRGQGWALLGLTGARSERLRPRVDALVTALSRCEEDGRWRTVVDAQDSPVENSVSALVALGVMSGVRAGVLDASWLAMSDRALDAAVAAIDGDGGLPVSSATPVGVPDTYAERDTGVHPWGQGPLLLALLAANGTQSR